MINLERKRLSNGWLMRGSQWTITGARPEQFRALIEKIGCGDTARMRSEAEILAMSLREDGEVRLRAGLNLRACTADRCDLEGHLSGAAAGLPEGLAEEAKFNDARLLHRIPEVAQRVHVVRNAQRGEVGCLPVGDVARLMKEYPGTGLSLHLIPGARFQAEVEMDDEMSAVVEKTMGFVLTLWGDGAQPIAEMLAERTEGALEAVPADDRGGMLYYDLAFNPWQLFDKLGQALGEDGRMRAAFAMDELRTLIAEENVEWIPENAVGGCAAEGALDLSESELSDIFGVLDEKLPELPDELPEIQPELPVVSAEIAEIQPEEPAELPEGPEELPELPEIPAAVEPEKAEVQKAEPVAEAEPEIPAAVLPETPVMPEVEISAVEEFEVQAPVVEPAEIIDAGVIERCEKARMELPEIPAVVIPELKLPDLPDEIPERKLSPYEELKFNMDKNERDFTAKMEEYRSSLSKGIEANLDGYRRSLREMQLRTQAENAATTERLKKEIAELTERNWQGIRQMRDEFERRYGKLFEDDEDDLPEDSDVASKPADPVKPVTPVTPVKPVAPVEPVKPVKPAVAGDITAADLAMMGMGSEADLLKLGLEEKDLDPLRKAMRYLHMIDENTPDYDVELHCYPMFKFFERLMTNYYYDGVYAPYYEYREGCTAPRKREVSLSQYFDWNWGEKTMADDFARGVKFADGTKFAPNIWLTVFNRFGRVRKIRNQCAHTDEESKLTFADVATARDLLFKGGGSLMRVMLRCGRATTSF